MRYRWKIHYWITPMDGRNLWYCPAKKKWFEWGDPRLTKPCINSQDFRTFRKATRVAIGLSNRFPDTEIWVCRRWMHKGKMRMQEFIVKQKKELVP